MCLYKTKVGLAHKKKNFASRWGSWFPFWWWYGDVLSHAIDCSSNWHMISISVQNREIVGQLYLGFFHWWIGTIPHILLQDKFFLITHFTSGYNDHPSYRSHDLQKLSRRRLGCIRAEHFHSWRVEKVVNENVDYHCSQNTVGWLQWVLKSVEDVFHVWVQW